MKVFTSYATEYDSYRGSRSIAELQPSEQDELIRATLGTHADFRALAVKHGLRKSQVEGLWAVVVFSGLALEAAGGIRQFDTRTDREIREIVAFLSGTILGLRVEEAYPPFDFLTRKTDYDWSELEGVTITELSEALGQPINTCRAKISDCLDPAPSHLKAEFIDRMPYHAFKHAYGAGRLILFVDRGMSLRAAQAGKVRHAVVAGAPVLFWVGLLAFIPLWVFAGFIYGVAALALSWFATVVARRILVREIRRLAITDRDTYEWLLSRRVIWMRYV